MQLAPIVVLKNRNNSISDLNFWQQNTVEELSLNLPNNLLLTGYQKHGIIDIWDLKKRRVIESVNVEETSQSTVGVFGLNNAVIGICCKEGNFQLLDGNSGFKTIVQLDIENIGFCKPFYMYNDNDLIMSTPSQIQSAVDVYDVMNKKIISTLFEKCSINHGMLMCTYMYKSNQQIYLLAGYEDGTLVLYNVLQQKCLSSVELYDKEPIMCIDYDELNNFGIAGSAKDFLCRFCVKNFEIIKSKEIPISNSGVSSIKIRPDRKLLAAAAWDHSVKIFSWAKVRPLAILKYHSESVQSVAFNIDPNPKQQILASGSSDGRIAIWDIYT